LVVARNEVREDRGWPVTGTREERRERGTKGGRKAEARKWG
jgi:hypothetical protein